MLIEAPGREVVTCANAELALAELEARVFDLVITDVSLPGLSGTELVRRAVARRADQWAVLCSGYQFGAATQALGRHVRSLPKPFEVEELDALIDEVMRERSSSSPPAAA